MRLPSIYTLHCSALVIFLYIGCGDSSDGRDGTAATGGSENGGHDGHAGHGGADPDLVRPIYESPGTTAGKLRLSFLSLPIKGVERGTDLAFLPDQTDYFDTYFLMTESTNALHLVRLLNGVPSLEESWKVADESDIYTGEACGPTNVLFDPEYQDNHFIYITYCKDAQTSQLQRFTWTASDGLGDSVLIYETSKPDATKGWHRMGSMGWEDDQVLWLLVGDHDDRLPNPHAQDPSTPLGSLIRIVPNRDPKGSGHTYPQGNLADEDDAPPQTDPGIFAYGLRSPWRGTRDSRGRIWVGDVGLESYEEVNLVTTVGQNFGWSTHEGPCQTDCDGFTDPITSYTRTDEDPYIVEEPDARGGDKRAIWVGEIYDDPSVDRYDGMMDGVVPFGDFFSGNVRGLRANNKNELTMDAPLGVLRSVTSWKVGADGYAYAIDLWGQLHVAVLGE